MDVVLLHNAKAGDESWSRNDLVKLVRRAGFEPRYFTLRRALAEPRLLDWGEFVIVAGGDGALCKVALALLGRNRPIAPLPLGTANNIARSLGLSRRPEDIVSGWRKLRSRPFDVGLLEGPWGRRPFFEGVGVGLISRSIAVLEEIDEVAVYEYKKAKHKLHRDVCVAASLAREMRPIPASLALEGRHFSGDFLLVEILNIRRAGPGVEVAPHASPSDGRFDVVSATADQRPRLLRTLKARLKDKDNVRSMSTRRARRVHLEVRVPCELRIDDDTLLLAAGNTIEITMKPGALQFVLPGK